MSSTKYISLLVGTGGSSGIFSSPTPDGVSSFLSSVSSLGITQLDTAVVYPTHNFGGSEQILGECHASEKFAIDTKVFLTGLGTANFGEGSLTREKIRDSLNKSLERLGVERVRTLYCHSPDVLTALEETVGAMDELWKEGKFERWGISNYSIDMLKEILAICEDKDFVKPGVYQGMYNVLCRHAEEALLPLLAEHNISFVAYGPTAGGLFASQTSSRYSGSSGWTKMYKTDPKMTSASTRIFTLAQQNGLGAMEMALRWTVHDSPLRDGDGVIFGASNESQLKQNVEWIGKGSVGKDVREKLEEIWHGVKDVAPGATLTR